MTTKPLCGVTSEWQPAEQGEVKRSHCVDPTGHKGLHSWEREKLQQLDESNPEPCGENSCICYCNGACHACGCDCPPSVDGHF